MTKRILRFWLENRDNYYSVKSNSFDENERLAGWREACRGRRKERQHILMEFTVREED